jgi:nitroreductase
MFSCEFGLPGDYDPIGGITVGYRADDLPKQSPGIGERRRDAADAVHRGQWGRHG